MWLMRQAGRYLPEFREIRKKNTDFIKLCLNPELSKEITLQPIKRFGFDAAVIFSDILMVPYGIGQSVKFKKNFGPQLGHLNSIDLDNISEKEFTDILAPVYKLLANLKNDSNLIGKDLIGFVGAPWTLMVYMINEVSPKNGLKNNFFENKKLIDKLLNILDQFIKLHIKNQVESGASIIQIFDSWAGLINDKFDKFLYNPTKSLVDYTKQLGVPVICFPRNIGNYPKFCNIVNPDAISIDYNVDPRSIINEISIPVQGGLDPNILLTDKENLRQKVREYLKIFNNHPYIFNLGHGILPTTEIDMVEELVKVVREFK
tara:strand:- start:176 stop:1126 length:951 start_codon:yes stop_codon:yes gene_type:complete